MAKRRKTYQKMSIKDILKGKFLVEGNAFSNWKFLLFIIFLGFIMITAAHLTDTKVVKIEQKKEKLDELKARYALQQSKLLKLQLESELAIQMKSDSLESLEEHPIKIVVE